MVLLRKSIPQNQNLKTADELGVKHMKNILLKYSISILLLFVSIESHPHQVVETYPYVMNEIDYSSLRTISCKINREEIEFSKAYKFESKSKEVFVGVECSGVFNEGGKQPFNIESCNKKNGVWKCEPGEEGYKIEINKRKLKLILHGVPLELASSTLSKISNSWFQSSSIDELIGNKCSVSYAESKDELNYECGFQSRITVSFFCPTSYCPRILWIN